MTHEPDIILGVPGQWPTRSDIVTAIARLSGGLIFAGHVLHDTTTNHSYQLDVYEHDPDLARAFALAGRRSLSDIDLAAIDAHTYTLYVIGTGGSRERAKQLMQVCTRLLQAGGLAVKIETAGVAHSANDWQTFTTDPEPSALYSAYVTLIGTPERFYSCGMHNLGLPDAVVPGRLSANEAAQLLETFLRYLFLEQPNLKTGQTFSSDVQAPRYQLRLTPCTFYAADDPFYNPYGLWMLE
jgi:hypothetical protein